MGEQQRRAPARLIRVALTLVLLTIAVAALVYNNSGGPTSPSARSDAIAASLRCPTCSGLSVKDSQAPMASSMRDIIDEQIAAGRSDEQIRGHFVDLYSDWVLLQPPVSGGGWLIWAVPILVAVVGVVFVLAIAGRLRVPRFAGWGVVLIGVGMVIVLSLQVNTGDRAAGGLITGTTPVPADPDGRSQGSTGPSSGAPSDPAPGAPSDEAAQRRVEQLREKVQADPDNTGLRLSLAAKAFTVGQGDVVRTNAQAVLEKEPRNVDALLLRSLSVSRQDDSQGIQAVRDYLQLAPQEHPGREVVESMAEQLGVNAADE